DEKGILRNGLPEYTGQYVFKANPQIVELLRKRGALLHSDKLEHSYPHCWRCHNPVIFRATEQWFISMETPMPGDLGRAERLNAKLRVLEKDLEAAKHDVASYELKWNHELLNR